jgi:hypothetical protein
MPIATSTVNTIANVIAPGWVGSKFTFISFYL